MTDEELYEKAKAESGSMVFYSTTSLAEIAATNFHAKYSDLSVTYSGIGEADIFTKLTTEIGSAAQGADMALVSNAYRMNTELIEDGLTVNYFPDKYKDVVPAQQQAPCVICLNQKLFFYNNTGAAST